MAAITSQLTMITVHEHPFSRTTRNMCAMPSAFHHMGMPWSTRITSPRSTLPCMRRVVAARAAPTMADPTHQARVDALMQKFMDADHDGNGVIDKDELRALLESVGGEPPSQHWLGDDEVDAIFQLYDKDGNGTISFDEFVHLAEDGILLDGKLHEYEVVFNALDTDNDGTLSALEIRAAMRQLGAPEITMAQVREILTEVRTTFNMKTYSRKNVQLNA